MRACFDFDFRSDFSRATSILEPLHSESVPMGKEKKPKIKKNKKRSAVPKKKKAKTTLLRLEDYEEHGFTDEPDSRVLASLKDLWAQYPLDGWYEQGSEYWDHTGADDDGMLGGLTDDVKVPDELASLELLKLLQGPDFGVPRGHAYDCGAGIGRVTKNVLRSKFDSVTVVEQEERFVKVAKETIPDIETSCVGLQDWNPAAKSTDVVWVQWVVGHLRDDHFVRFIHRAFAALRDCNGVLVIKDNACAEPKHGFVMDVKDHSVTRTERHLRHIFKVAGAKIVHFSRQPGFPAGMFPVYMWVLKPKNEPKEAVAAESEIDSK